jgi:hypothetical protein
MKDSIVSLVGLRAWLALLLELPDGFSVLPVLLLVKSVWLQVLLALLPEPHIFW